MRKVIRLKGSLIDSFSLFATLGEKPNITNGDLNNVKVMGTYHIAETVAPNITNAPFNTATALMVITFNESARVVQRAYATNGQVKERYFNGEWGEWYTIPHFTSGTTPPTNAVEGDIFFQKV